MGGMCFATQVPNRTGNELCAKKTVVEAPDYCIWL